MPDNETGCCGKCGAVFRPGQTRYIVTINLVADFDGRLGAPGGAAELGRLMAEAERMTEDELMDEVVHKLVFTLCKPCRDRWSKAPLGEIEDNGSAVRRPH